MKFWGRISGLLMLTAVLLIYHFLYKFLYLDKYYMVNFIWIIAFYILSWTCGWQYDKATYYARELNKSREELQQILDNVEAGIWSSNIRTNSKIVSAGIEKIYGRPKREFMENPDIWKETIYEEDRDVISKLDDDAFKKSGERCIHEYRIVHPDGKIIWVQSRVTPIFDDDNNLISINGFIVDITNRKNLEKSLVEAEMKYRSLVEEALIGIYICQNNRLIYVNSRFEEVSGYSCEELQNIDVLSLLVPEYRQIVAKDLLEQNINNLKVRKQAKAYKKDGSIIDVEINAASITYNGAPALIGTVHDISVQKKALRQMNKIAYHDALTGLPNRYLLNKYIKKSIYLSSINNQSLGIMFIDLDRFKIINDTMGHSLGDEVLRKVAERLLTCIERDDIVSRLGGDEFVMLLKNVDKNKVSDIAQRVLNEISKPFMIDGHEIFITPSIGISMYPLDGDEVEALIKYADTAMYEAKRLGKNNYQFYTPQLNKEVSRKMKIEHDLRKALENNEFILYYQPQVDLKTGKIISLEALIRWDNPELGIVSPMEFIPLAEETGLIIPIGRWVLKAACKQNKNLQDIGLSKIPVAVNISARQLMDRDFINVIKQTLEETRLEPKYLELEITESIIQNTERLHMILKRLKAMGIKVAVDDFGTGYSFLRMLKHLPIDIIKIDKSFIDEIIENRSTRELVKTIIELGHTLNVEVIAEGIECEEQADFLIHNNFNKGQGYLFGKPMDVNEMGLMLKEING